MLNLSTSEWPSEIICTVAQQRQWMVSYLGLLLCTDMSDKYASGPKEIASQSSCIFFSLSEFACCFNSQFKVTHWNHNCGSINNVLQEGKCLDPQVLKMEIMPNLQLHEMWGHLVWCALIFKSWVLLGSPRDDSHFYHSSGLLSVRDCVFLERPWWAGRHKGLPLSAFPSEAWLYVTEIGTKQEGR